MSTQPINDGGPVAYFHCLFRPGELDPFKGNEPVGPEEVRRYLHVGMSFRAHAAAMAMQGILASPDEGMGFYPKSIAENAVKTADALIAALAAPKAETPGT